MTNLSWSGTPIGNPWGDLGSPGDPPRSGPPGGEIFGISNNDIWGNGLETHSIYGTADVDVIFLDVKGYDTPRLINVTQFYSGTGNDLVDLTSARFNYGATLVNGGTGNDWLLGNSGNDRFFGVAGNDYLKGYGGKDSLSGGDNNDRLYGGRGNDKLNGGSGHDYLYGEFGKDTLAGGKGNDRFVFDVSPISANRDTITDFSVRDDSIHLARSIFTKVGAKGALKSGAFWTGSEAHDANDRIIYNDDTGYLYYDRDGTGGAQQQAIAKLSKHLEITHKDFFIV
ncbi:calcium-binding protein [Microvirga ossetica]|uniref:calcium-binding protein n=1 Tax=Microvirga ossetica TaxID=1882682 RepID=UPI000C14B202|nr:calcium-binding protein [Microvirga ossetica]